jgi:hypothetical protein
MVFKKGILIGFSFDGVEVYMKTLIQAIPKVPLN